MFEGRGADQRVINRTTGDAQLGHLIRKGPLCSGTQKPGERKIVLQQPGNVVREPARRRRKPG